MKIDTACADAKCDEQDVPQVRMQREPGQRIVQAACIGKHSDTAQKTVAHKKSKSAALRYPASEPRVYKEHIHRDAAELKWKIPPDVRAVSDDKSQDKLFPYLAGKHDDAAEEKDGIGYACKMSC